MKIIWEKGMLRDGRYGVEWVRVRTPSPRAIVFIPPLIGGHYAQQIRHFRRLTRQGYDLVSLNYSGHGESAGKFCLASTLRDTLEILNQAHSTSRSEKISLYGIASCYGAIPLLHGAHRLKEPFHKLVIINGILGLNPGAVLRSFRTYYRQLYSGRTVIPRLADGIKRYADFMFPGIRKGRDSFGILERHRARLLKTLCDFFTLNPLAAVRLEHTPLLCLYGLEDRVLRIYDAGIRSAYEEAVQRICPQARFYPFDSDHFLSDPLIREKAFRAIVRFFNMPDPDSRT